MPRYNARNFQKSPVERGRELRPRMSRHNRALLGPAPSGSSDARPSPFMKPAILERRVIEAPPGAANGIAVVQDDGSTKHFTVQHVEIVPARPMSHEEVQRDRAKVLRATQPTTNYGQKNTPASMAPRGTKLSKSPTR